MIHKITTNHPAFMVNDTGIDQLPNEIGFDFDFPRSNYFQGIQSDLIYRNSAVPIKMCSDCETCG